MRSKKRKSLILLIAFLSVAVVFCMIFLKHKVADDHQSIDPPIILDDEETSAPADASEDIDDAEQEQATSQEYNSTTEKKQNNKDQKKSEKEDEENAESPTLDPSSENETEIIFDEDV